MRIGNVRKTIGFKKLTINMLPITRNKTRVAMKKVPVKEIWMIAKFPMQRVPRIPLGL